MVKGIILSSVIFVATGIFAQESYIQPGLLKATATIAPSTMLNRSVQNIYISGFLEYHLDKKLSLRGETFVFVDGQSKNATNNTFVEKGMRTYFGAFYHFNKNNWDQYIGFQPGVALMKPLSSIDPNAPLQLSPSFAAHVGSTYYVWKYFNFYVDLAYVHSSYRGLAVGTQKTDELILSAGLGFQIQTKKEKMIRPHIAPNF
ncbi:MAG: hypothetical protein RI883_2058 [Bacteroidota bacterium]|jgi:hypothetical protein